MRVDSCNSSIVTPRRVESVTTARLRAGRTPGSVFLRVEWSFKSPVRPGDQITAEAEILEMRNDKPIFTLRTTITNQDGTVVLDGTALVYREPLS